MLYLHWIKKHKSEKIIITQTFKDHVGLHVHVYVQLYMLSTCYTTWIWLHRYIYVASIKHHRHIYCELILIKS